MQLPPYRAPRWLVGGHAQTIYPALLLRPTEPAMRRENWTTPDGDEIAVDWLGDRAQTPGGAPLVAMFHGLEGSSRSHYALAMFHQLLAIGWQGVVPHFRGCGGLPNRRPRAYHAGDSDEIGWMLGRLRAVHAGPLFVVGVSLGGNALAKWLGEQGAAARLLVNGAAVVSSPLDLVAAGSVLDRGFNRRVYTRNFLRTLRPKTLQHLQRFSEDLARLNVDPQEIQRASTFREFDDRVTAPLHGFRNVDDYWVRASGKPWLRHIEVPTLVINARNDPFLPEHALPSPADVSAQVTLLQPAQGGHVGFVDGGFPGRIDWLPRCLLTFFQAHADDQRRSEYG
ncbi:YheT family hydrolase [Parachitinimonas caeni]|uniref:Alpha/beta fold hydrolase n=1 Tax=Parachitinimonas caeni TaxID=3031301 RepID=A0ABT7DZQ7_9NEIS|nr:alpha/beta fold hydrolase [Parachitinimonas caeni]MDK2124568.1 alpha/beta fold hydrolase [Parachitinimonas caeni]